MRLASILTLAAVGVAGAASASPEDRYGPPAENLPAQAAGGSAAVATAVPYRGPFLRWPGKAASEPIDPPAAALSGPAPMAYAPPPMRLASLPPRRDLPAAPVASGYAPPRPAFEPARPMSPPAPRPASEMVPVARRFDPSPAPPSPSQAATNAPAVVVATGPAAGGPAAPVRARYYSLHREYGDAPDRISLPPSRPPVLIGPSDGSNSTMIGEDPASRTKSAKPRSAEDSPAF